MLQRLRASFLSSMSTQLPSLISWNRIIDEREDGYYHEMIFLTSRKLPMDDVIKMFKNDAHLYILYHRVTSEGLCGWQSCCGFSHPDKIRMYKFNALTDDDGLVSYITVRIYDDLEFYMSELLDDLKKQRERGRLRVEMDRADILKIFFT